MKEYPMTVGQLQNCNIHVTGASEREEGDKGTAAKFEAVMTEILPKLTSGSKPQVQEAQKATSRINVKKNYTYAYKSEEEIKTFSNKQKLEFVASSPAL